ncbi:hypothetical protein [Paenibacillus sonchi]|uniref:hypothetical protein n=1 Tax=Paenibacillus sonchi TaxID=373687 RepID=UPI001E481636|nr:hypothetical protein [Paenibacillus sonchi]MCE3200752.1 hypothetical protein [Paenibacillus sonchi]
MKRIAGLVGIAETVKEESSDSPVIGGSLLCVFTACFARFLGKIPYLALRLVPEAAQADIPIYLSAVRIHDSAIGIKLHIFAGLRVRHICSSPFYLW